MSAWAIFYVGFVIVLALIGVVAFAAGVEYGLDQPRPAMVQTRLVVPVPCLEALEHGDTLVLLVGEAYGDAADPGTTGGDLADLLERAAPATEEYKRAATRCRQLGEAR